MLNAQVVREDAKRVPQPSLRRTISKGWITDLLIE